MILSLLRGVALGLSLAAPPGPMNALIARESSRNGFLRGLKVGVAAPLADVCYLVLLLLARPFLNGLGDFARVLAVLGALLMGYLAWSTLKPQEEAKASKPMPFAQAFAVAITNPFQIAWWTTAGIAFLTLEGPIGILGFVLGIFSWVAVISFLIAHGAKKWTWFPPVVKYASGTLLVLFAAILAVYGIFGYQI